MELFIAIAILIFAVIVVIYPEDREENTKYIDNLINRNSEICSKDKIIDIKQEKIETAKRMLDKKVDIQIIIDATGLTKEEIEKL